MGSALPPKLEKSGDPDPLPLGVGWGAALPMFKRLPKSNGWFGSAPSEGVGVSEGMADADTGNEAGSTEGVGSAGAEGSEGPGVAGSEGVGAAGSDGAGVEGSEGAGAAGSEGAGPDGTGADGAGDPDVFDLAKCKLQGHGRSKLKIATYGPEEPEPSIPPCTPAASKREGASSGVSQVIL